MKRQFILGLRAKSTPDVGLTFSQGREVRIAGLIVHFHGGMSDPRRAVQEEVNGQSTPYISRQLQPEKSVRVCARFPVDEWNGPIMSGKRSFSLPPQRKQTFNRRGLAFAVLANDVRSRRKSAKCALTGRAGTVCC